MSPVEQPGLTTLSVSDTALVAGMVFLPPLAQGVIIRRPRVVGLAERLDADRRAGAVLRMIRRRYGSGPLRLRIPRRNFALALGEPDVERLLAGTPRPFSPATLEKRAALRHFQPAGLLISDLEHRAVRRPFNEAVLGLHGSIPQVQAHVGAAVEAELLDLLRRLPVKDGGAVLSWRAFRETFWHIVRRVTLGDSARDDTEITDLLDRLRRRANWAYLAPVDPRALRDLADRLRRYVADAEPGSLAAIVAATPAEVGVAPIGQIPHWLFAFDAAAIATYRAIGLLAAHPQVADSLAEEAARQQRVAAGPASSPAGPAGPPTLARAVLLESVRLWPTTLLLLRESGEETIWSSGRAPAGTTFVIVSSYVHREAARPALADRFSPALWSDGEAPAESFVPFSAGPASCAGRSLVLDVAGSILAKLAEEHRLGLEGRRSRLVPGRPLPRTLDQTRLRFRVAPRPSRPRPSPQTPDAPGPTGPPASSTKEKP